MRDSSLYREDVAWAAGFFDGEGHFGCSSSNRSWPLLATISQKDRQVLDRFRAIVGVGDIYYHTFKTNHVPLYRWHTGSFESVQHVIATLWAFLGPVKRQQAKDTIAKYRSAPVRRQYRNGRIPACARWDVGRGKSCTCGTHHFHLSERAEAFRDDDCRICGTKR